jgi:predicted  nucleic acid-binding Zn-ribbon protein
MKKLLQRWLGITNSNIAFFEELEHVLNRVRDLESLCDDLKYEQENLEYNLGELEVRVDEVEEIDIQNFKDDLKDKVNSLKDEVNDVLSDFEIMTEGYTVSVKLNPPLS